jgi:hypothetical protein
LFALMKFIYSGEAMTRIIAGRFQEQEQVEKIMNALCNAGVAQNRMSTFYLNPPGQHDLYSIGGDRDDSPGAQETAKGVAGGASTGGAVGAAVGLVGVPVFGPVAPAVGALVGAHVGGLVGSLSTMKEKGQSEETSSEAHSDENEFHQRKAGMLVAVTIDEADLEHGTVVEGEIIRLFQMLGGKDIEEADGTIIDGNWEDFDPLTLPKLIRNPDSNGNTSRSG